MGMFQETEPQQVVVKTIGKDLVCQLCGFDRFRKRPAKLFRDIFSSYWLDPLAECCICGRCGYVHWFSRGKGLLWQLF